MAAYPVGTILWARPRKPKTDIFWPAKVVDNETGKKNVVVSVMFLGENTFEDVKDDRDIQAWNCSDQDKMIKKGGMIKHAEKKLCFTKGLAEAIRVMGEPKQISETINNNSTCTEQDKIKVKRTIFPIDDKPSGSNKDIGSTPGRPQSKAKDVDSKNKEKNLPKSNRTSKGKKDISNTDASVGSGVKRKKSLDVGLHGNSKRTRSASRSRTIADQTDPAGSVAKRRCNSASKIRERVSRIMSAKGDTKSMVKTSSKEEQPNTDLRVCTNGHHENDSSSDDEMMEGLLSSPEKIQYNLNDVVWAKLGRDPYWPAVVKRIEKRKNYVHFLGYHSRTFIAVKRIEPFSCDARTNFIEQAKMYNSDLFEEASQQAEDFVRKKALGVLSDSSDGEYELQEEIPSALESVVEKMEKQTVRRSSREKKQVDPYSDILMYIKQAKPVIKLLMEEKKPSERLSVYRKGTQKERNLLKHRSGFGPVKDNDVCEEIMNVLRDLYREVVGSDSDFGETTLLYDVWLPEAMILGLQGKLQISKKRAEQIYLGQG